MLVVIAKGCRESLICDGGPNLVSLRSRRGSASTNAQSRPAHLRRVAHRREAALTLDTTAMRYSHIYTVRYAFVC